jgi:hypothetical protein
MFRFSLDIIRFLIAEILEYDTNHGFVHKKNKHYKGKLNILRSFSGMVD